MKTFGSLLEQLGGKNPRDGIIEGADGFYTRDGYPVTRFGRPDWCAKCSAVQADAAKYDPNDRPKRVVHEVSKEGQDVARGLCAEHLEAEMRIREERRERATGGRRP